MTRKYETIFILKPTLTEEERVAKIEFIQNTLTKNGAEIASTVEMGTRELGYDIKKFKRGYYVVIYFSAPSQTILELERVYSITEDVIKFMSVKFENKTELKAWDEMVAKTKKAS